MTTNEDVAQRFAARLRLLLDTHGVTMVYASRCAQIGKQLGGDASLGVRLLDGNALPEWPLFFEVCKQFQVEPGYFLDTKAPHDLPRNTEVVPSSTGGDPVVWRAPDGTDPTAGEVRSLAWVRGRTLHANVRETDVVVYDQRPALAIVPDGAYLLRQDGRLVAKHCVRCNEGMIVLREHGHPDLILPLQNGKVTARALKNLNITEMLPIVGLIRPASTFAKAA